jgi:hypothetical protein
MQAHTLYTDLSHTIAAYANAHPILALIATIAACAAYATYASRHI